MGQTLTPEMGRSDKESLVSHRSETKQGKIVYISIEITNLVAKEKCPSTRI